VNIVLAAVGRCRPGPEKSLFDHYSRRLTWRLQLKEVEERRPLPAPERKLREAALLQGTIPKGALVVVLDERGQSLSSAAFAEQIAVWRDSGRRELAFLVGGADGHDDTLRHAADLLLSLGPMTWPHMLVRGLLAEQIYRAESILANHPYHRGSSTH
jgi:23S rRNA (pseudouridine1915-N3)-methyltransferase